jgi:predicted nucleotide-binding protein (sugar kinase/HSP70/actin superfamily)
VRLGWTKSAALDWAGRRERWLRPRTDEPARAGKVTDRLRRDVDAAGTVHEVLRARRRAEAEFAALPVDDSRRPLRIRVVGESYCVLEPAVNFDVLRRLGDLGVEAVPFETAHEWLGFHSVRIGNGQLHRLERACSPWWRMCVGGEDLSALGWLALAPEEGFDGVLHLHPFACMPSTAVEPGMQQASEQLGIPLLGLALDEHTSEAGVLTRLEAFVSLLERRRLRGKRLPKWRSGPVSRSRRPVAAAIPRQSEPG